MFPAIQLKNSRFKKLFRFLALTSNRLNRTWLLFQCHRKLHENISDGACNLYCHFVTCSRFWCSVDRCDVTYFLIVKTHCTSLLRVFLLELLRQRLEHNTALDEVIKVHRPHALTVKHTYTQVTELRRTEANTYVLSLQHFWHIIYTQR